MPKASRHHTGSCAAGTPRTFDMIVTGEHGFQIAEGLQFHGIYGSTHLVQKVRDVANSIGLPQFVGQCKKCCHTLVVHVHAMMVGVAYAIAKHHAHSIVDFLGCSFISSRKEAHILFAQAREHDSLKLSCCFDKSVGEYDALKAKRYFGNRLKCQRLLFEPVRPY